MTGGGKFKVVVQKPAGAPPGGAAERYAIEREALDPIGAAIVEVDAADEAEFIAAARDAEPVVYPGEPVLPDGIPLGANVVVVADEYGSGTVAGQLAPSGLHEVAVRRQTERAGEVVVHFPREDYMVVRAG